MNYNNAPKKKKKSKLGLIIIIIVVLIQIISAVFTVSADNDTTTDNNYNGGNGTNKDIKFPDYPDFSTLYGDNSSDDALSSESSSTVISSSTTSSKYNSSYGTNSKYNSSYGTNSYNNNNNVNKEEETSNGIDITSYSGYLYNQLSNTGKTVFLSFMKELASGGQTCVFKNVTNKSTFKAELEKAIKAADQRGIAKFFVITKVDSENRDFYKLDKLYGDAEEIKFVSIDERAANGEL